MQTEVEIKKGDVRNFYGKDIDGMINYSDLSHYKAKSISKHYSVKYVLKGRENYWLNGMKQTVLSGQFLLVKPTQTVEVEINPQKSAQGICIYVSPETFETALTGQSHNEVILPDFPMAATHLSGFFQELSAFKLTSNPDALLQRCMSHFKSFLKENNKNLHNIDAEKAATKLDLWKKIEQGRVFMNNNYHQKIRLQDIAKEACISPFHFQRTFKAFYNTSPTDYLFQLRMQKACAFENTSDSQIHEIAEKCGFDDVKYFKKCLKNFKAANS